MEEETPLHSPVSAQTCRDSQRPPSGVPPRQVHFGLCVCLCTLVGVVCVALVAPLFHATVVRLSARSFVPRAHTHRAKTFTQV